jgi:hypothetical protein
MHWDKHRYLLTEPQWKLEVSAILAMRKSLPSKGVRTRTLSDGGFISVRLHAFLNSRVV